MEEKYGVGKKFKTNEGYEIEIVEKLKGTKRKVRFENGYEVITYMHNIESGNIKNPYHSSVFRVGYFGVGNYRAQIKGKNTSEYNTWKHMLERCCDNKYQEKKPTYKGTTICSEWHNFQNFAKWYEENFPKIEGIKFSLDKDLLQEDVENKIYSPTTCVFLPQSVNSFLTNKHSDNTSSYTGVSWHRIGKKWVSNIRLFGEGKIKNLGLFTTPEDASEVYQQARAEQSEKVKSYLRELNYLPEEIINLIK